MAEAGAKKTTTNAPAKKGFYIVTPGRKGVRPPKEGKYTESQRSYYAPKVHANPEQFLRIGIGWHDPSAILRSCEHPVIESTPSRRSNSFSSNPDLSHLCCGDT